MNSPHQRIRHLLIALCLNIWAVKVKNVNTDDTEGLVGVRNSPLNSSSAHHLSAHISTNAHIWYLINGQYYLLIYLFFSPWKGFHFINSSLIKSSVISFLLTPASAVTLHSAFWPDATSSPTFKFTEHNLHEEAGMKLQFVLNLKAQVGVDRATLIWRLDILEIDADEIWRE